MREVIGANALRWSDECEREEEKRKKAVEIQDDSRRAKLESINANSYHRA